MALVVVSSKVLVVAFAMEVVGISVVVVVVEAVVVVSFETFNLFDMVAAVVNSG